MNPIMMIASAINFLLRGKPSMTSKETMEALLAGKKVRLSHWDNDKYLILINDRLKNQYGGDMVLGNGNYELCREKHEQEITVKLTLEEAAFVLAHLANSRGDGVFDIKVFDKFYRLFNEANAPEEIFESRHTPQRHKETKVREILRDFVAQNVKDI